MKFDLSVPDHCLFILFVTRNSRKDLFGSIFAFTILYYLFLPIWYPGYDVQFIFILILGEILI